MDFINLRNDINKIGKNYSASIQKRKDKKTVVETKSVQASSLDALSSYGLATIKRASISEPNLTPDEKVIALTNKINSDENLNYLNIPKFLKPENVEIAQLLCYGVDEQGREVFPDKKQINNTLDVLHLNNYDFALELLIGKDEQGNDLFQDKSLIWGILSHIHNKEEMINIIKNLEPKMLDEFNSIPAFKNLTVTFDDEGNLILPPEDEIISTVSDFVEKGIQLAKQLCYGKDNNGNQLFPNKDKISSVLANDTEIDLDFLSLLSLGRNQNGESLFSSFDKLHTILVWLKDLKRPDLIEKIYFGKDEKGNAYLPDKQVATDILYEFINLYKKSNSENVVDKISFFENLCFAKTENGEDVFPNKEVISQIMPYTYWGRLDIIEDLCFGKNSNGDELVPNKERIPVILSEIYSRTSHGSPSDAIVQQRFEFVNEILKTLGRDVLKYPNIFRCVSCINEENIEFINQLCFEKDSSGNALFEQKDFIGEIAHSINRENIDFIKKLCFGKDEKGNDLFPRKDLISKISKYVTSINVEFVEQLCFGKDEKGNDLFSQKDLIPEIIECSHFQIKDILKELCFGKDEKGNDLFSRKDLIKKIYHCVTDENVEIVRKLCFGKDEKGNELFEQKDLIPSIIPIVNRKNCDFVETLCIAKDKNGDDLFPQKDLIPGIARYVNKENSEVASILCYGKDEFGHDLFSRKDLINELLSCVHKQNSEFMLELCYGKDKLGNDLFPQKDLISRISYYVNQENSDLIKKLCYGKDKLGNDLFPQKDLISRISYYVNQENSDLIKKLCYEKDESGSRVFLQNGLIFNILPNIHSKNISLAHVLCFEKNEQGEQICFDFKLISEILKYSNDEDIEDVKFLLSLLENKEISFNEMIVVLDKSNNVSFEDITKLQALAGKDATEKLSTLDLSVACRMIDLINKKDTNEIDLAKKKILIRNLVDANVSLYNASAELKNICPLLPTNKEEYCSLLQSLCKSIGIETNELSTSEISEFNKSVDFISSHLRCMTDEKFNDLQIEQAYSKDDFINNVLNIVSDLEKNEKQKVFDYFGFELVPNENTKIGYSILGYPVNLNNGKKLAKIENPQTQAVIEKLRQEVIRFSQENPVICSDKNLEADINKVLELCPELRTQIGRVQHGKHEFDVFKHSLKVMQKIVQKSEFGQLSDSDKKVLLLASLLHDTTKLEGKQDICHASESAFDAFYITKKFNLSKEETNKLYTLIKFHEWLGSANSSSIKNEAERENIRKSLAYDLHYDNIFELSKILTEADLKAVQSNDGFFDDVKKIFDINSTEIGRFVTELKSSQPLLPVTKIPPASKIKEAITVVNEDGSTNLKGIYQDKNGMVIIKYNEVENETWGKIGFAKDSVSRGIKPVNYQTHVDTGNMKFFAHGLDFAEQLQNFDAFALPDTDALLSVSYMERPESKYRLFRPQGVLLDVDTKYVHGGGNTDAGSGCKKSLDIFKEDYAYAGSVRHRDREYVSNIIKSSLGFTDSEYIEFVKQNENKPISEIEPESCRKKIVEVFASISSATRGGGRSYNEMYITNPRVMGVFAYPTDKEVGEIMAFVEKQHEFLKKYALEEDLPFVVFGN